MLDVPLIIKSTNGNLFSSIPVSIYSCNVQKAPASEFMVRKILVGKLSLCLISMEKMDIFHRLFGR